MTFARPINLCAGPTRGAYIFLAVVCLVAGLVAFFSAIAWPLKWVGAGITLACFIAGLIQLNKQRGWRVRIHNSGAINMGQAGAVQYPVELGQRIFRSRMFVTLPLRMAGKSYRYFLVNPANNDKDDFRRLLVWLGYGQD